MRQCKAEERGVPGTLTDDNAAMTHSGKHYVCVVSAQILAVILSHIFGFSRASSVSPPVCVIECVIVLRQIFAVFAQALRII